MNVTLNAELAQFIEDKVRAGDFESADDAVNRLLSFALAQKQAEDSELEHLREQIAEGIAEADRGEVADWDSEEVWAEVEPRYAEEHF